MAQELLGQIITAVVGIICTLIIPALAAMLVQWLRAKGVTIKEGKEALLSELAIEATMMASQLARNATIDKGERKPVAVRHVLERAGSLGIKIGADAAEGMVEAAVNRLKRARGAL